MILSEEQRKQLIALRLANADESLTDAATLLKHGSLRGAMSRCYYAVFHAASALAIRDDLTLHKHSALISFFHREYVNTGRLPQELGQIVQETFINRWDADYRDVVDLPLEKVTRLLNGAHRFVAELKSFLRTA